MQCEIKRMQFEVDELKRQRSGSSVIGSAGSKAPDRSLGRDEMRTARRNGMTAPVAFQPHECGRHLWDSLRRNEWQGGACERSDKVAGASGALDEGFAWIMEGCGVVTLLSTMRSR